MTRIILIRMFALMLLTVLGSARENHLNKSDLPAAVQKATGEVSQGATVRGYSTEAANGVREYEVEMVKDGHSKDVTMDEGGAVLEVEEQVDFKKLSPAVQAGLQSLAGKAKILKVESLTKHGNLVAYEAQLRRGAKYAEVQVGPDGKALAHME